MAERDFSNIRSVTNVEAEIPDQTDGLIADIGQDILNKFNASKVNENSSKAQLDLSALNNQWQIDNQADPFNPEALKSLGQQRKSILNQYGGNISPFYKSEWNETAQKLTANDAANTEAWGFKQAKENTVFNINSSLRNSMVLAGQNGSNYARNGGDLSTVLDFEAAKTSLAEFGNKNIGEIETQKLLKDFDRDYAKSFVAGAAETNPESAALLLQTPQFAEKFTPEDRDEMGLLIRRTAKMQNLNKEFASTTNGSEITDIINDPETSYFDKRLRIDQMELSGTLSNKTAANARRVLTSQKNVDAVTHSPIMADIVDKIYDLNANSSLNNADYLKGIQGLQADILEKQSNGELNVQDVQKLNNRISSLTSKRVSDATKSVGNDFYEANQSFKDLPPQYRGEATRQLFYSTDGKDLTPDQIKQQAGVIHDQIANRRRASAQKVVTKAIAAPILGRDERDFMVKSGISPEQLSRKAKKANMSEAEVLRQYRKQVEGKHEQ